MAEIKDEFKSKIQVLDYLIQEYKDELGRTTSFFNYMTKKEVLHRKVRKSRLRMLRLQISKILIEIERTYGYNYEYLEEDI